MTVIKKYNDGTSAWETIVVGKQGATGPEGPAGDPGSALIDAKGDLLAGTAADTLAALAVGTNNHVLTADSGEATGMKWAAVAAGGGGKVLQVVSATTSTTATNSSGSFADTNLTATITPSATSSKVLVLVSQWSAAASGSGQNGIGLRLLRGGTEIYKPYDNFNRSLFIGSTDEINGLQPLTFLDSPNTTSATTYKTQFVNYTAVAGCSARVQGGGGGVTGTSSIVLLEIGL